MSMNKKLLWAALVCALLAAGIYSAAYWKIKTSTPPTGISPTGKLAAASVADGTYTVHVRSIMMTPEDASIAFAQVTYFEGAEASSSAAQDVPCKDKPLEACVPTLVRGYYVRPSDAPDFTAPLTDATVIELKDKAPATLRDLQSLIREYEPVFDVDIASGNITSIRERTPLPNPKG